MRPTVYSKCFSEVYLCCICWTKPKRSQTVDRCSTSEGDKQSFESSRLSAASILPQDVRHQLAVGTMTSARDAVEQNGIPESSEWKQRPANMCFLIFSPSHLPLYFSGIDLGPPECCIKIWSSTSTQKKLRLLWQWMFSGKIHNQPSIE